MKKKRTLIIMVSVLSVLARSGVPALAQAPVATDVTAADIREFIEALPKDRVSDRPIRVVDVTGEYRIGVFGVFRPDGVVGDANLHRVNTTEIYYMLEGTATLITGGELIEPYEAPSSTTSLRGEGIEGGVSRRVVPGDIVVIPGHTPHWWSELEGDISYLIFRPDPDNRLNLK